MRRGEPELGVLVLHGMGSQEEGYSAGMQAALSGALGSDAGRIDVEEVYWARVLEEPEKELWAAMNEARDSEGRPLALRWRRTRRFLVHSFADALAYDRPGSRSSRYAAVHGVVSERADALYDRIGGATPVVVMAHSLGAHVISNYVWDTEAPPSHRIDCDGRDHDSPPRAPSPWRPLSTLAGLITFGANIPLFSLAFDHPAPVVLPAEGVDEPAVRAQAAWLNFLDPDDVLGWPLRPLYDPRTQALARALASRATDLGRARAPELGRGALLDPDPAEQVEDDAPRLSSPVAMHCRRRATVERIRDIPIDAGPFPQALTPLSHGEYWTDRRLIGPAAAYLRTLIAARENRERPTA